MKDTAFHPFLLNLIRQYYLRTRGHFITISEYFLHIICYISVLVVDISKTRNICISTPDNRLQLETWFPHIADISTLL